MRQWIGLCACLALVMFAGCSGENSHTVTTGEDGSLVGMLLLPNPQSLGIATSTDFDLTWRKGATPPSNFTVGLEELDPKEGADTTPIRTELEKVSTTHYILRPVGILGEGTFVMVRVRGAGEEERAIYLTHYSAFSGAPRQAAPADAGQDIHEVTVP